MNRAMPHPFLMRNKVTKTIGGSLAITHNHIKYKRGKYINKRHNDGYKNMSHLYDVDKNISNTMMDKLEVKK